VCVIIDKYSKKQFPVGIYT